MDGTMGTNFNLGGLAGMAFTGKTGWHAFGHHVAEKDGNIFCLYGPHVGLGMDGTMGKIRRAGQCKDTTCCGAAVAAYKSTQVPDDDEPMKALAYANFEIAHNLFG